MSPYDDGLRMAYEIQYSNVPVLEGVYRLWFAVCGLRFAVFGLRFLFLFLFPLSFLFLFPFLIIALATASSPLLYFKF